MGFSKIMQLKQESHFATFTENPWRILRPWRDFGYLSSGSIWDSFWIAKKHPRWKVLYSASGNKVFQSFKIFLRSRKKHFLVQQMFFWFKMFFHHSDPAGVAKKQFGSKKHFSFKMVIFAQNWSFLLIFGSFWTILAPFWAQKCFSVQKVFSGSAPTAPTAPTTPNTPHM